MAVKEWEDRIVFLRRVIAGRRGQVLRPARGAAGRAFRRASSTARPRSCATWRATKYDLSGRPRLARGTEPEGAAPPQMTLFTPPEQIVASVLRDVDVERLSPLAALNLLHSLKSRLG